MANTENTVAVKTSTTTTTSSSTESKIAKKSKKKRKQSSKKQKGKQPDSDAKVEAVQEAEEPRAVLEPPPKTKSNKKKRKKDRRVKTGAGADADGAQTKAYQEAISERQPKKQKLDHVKETDVKSRDQGKQPSMQPMYFCHYLCSFYTFLLPTNACIEAELYWYMIFCILFP